jgi:hypothetical protein
MADFQSQAMGLTGLTIDASSTTPSRAEFSTFLNDGVIDVTNRWLLVKPQDIDSFTREGAEQTSNGFNPGTNKIVSVIRESGTDGEWYPCSKKPINLQYLVTDVDSLHYASKYNPVYMITQNRNVHVYPAPSGAGNDGFKVLYVNSSPEETDGTALDHASTGIKWFPEDKVYLVVLYASMRSLQAKMADTTITDLSVTAVPPDVPSITASTISFSTTAPSYTTPTQTISGTNWSTAYPDEYSALNTALGAMTNELDKVDNILSTAEGKVDAYYTDIGDIDDTTELWDNTNKRFTVVRDALLQAQNLIDNNEPDAAYDAEANLADVDAAFAAMDAHLTDGEAILTNDPTSGAILTALDQIKANILLANGVIDSPPVPPDSASAFSLGGEFDDAMAKAKALIDDAGSLTQGDDAEAHLANEDSELIASTVQIASQELQRANLGLQDATQTFTSGLGKFSAEVQAYQAEVAEMSARTQGYIQTAQAYVGEVQARISYAAAYQQASAARGAEGNARINQLKGTVSVAAQELQRANVAIAEVNTIMASYRLDIEGVAPYLQTAQGYIGQAAGYANEVKALLSQVPAKVSEYQAKLQDALNEFNDDNAEYQAQLQVSIQNAQLEDAEEAKKLQKYAAEIQEYQAEVATQVQEYTQNLQADGMGYQWLQDQYTRLKAEYDQAFMLAAPKQQPQQQVRA